MIKNIPKYILDNLRKNNIDFHEAKIIDSGRNSSSWKLLNKNKNYFLKIYMTKDERDSAGKEISFLNLLVDAKFTNVPKPILYSVEDKWSLLSWIEGEEIHNPNLDDWIKLIDFISDIQRIKSSNLISKIGNASEACFNIEEHSVLIHSRVVRILKIMQLQKINVEIINWIIKYLLEPLDVFIKSLEHKHLKGITNKKIISQSDVGFHNILKKNNKLFFFDFEYAGWDDPYKLYSDLVIQPENILNYKEAVFIITKLSKLVDTYFDEKIFRKYIFLYSIKWSIIIMNQFLKNECNNFERDAIFKKAKAYLDKVQSIWDL